MGKVEIGSSGYRLKGSGNRLPRSGGITPPPLTHTQQPLCVPLTSSSACVSGGSGLPCPGAAESHQRQIDDRFIPVHREASCRRRVSVLFTQLLIGNVTLQKLPESGSMALSVLGVFLALLLEVSTQSSSAPRSSWSYQEVDLLEFWEPGVFNYTTLLLSEERGSLFVGAREAVYELNMSNISVKSNQVGIVGFLVLPLLWKVPENDVSMCVLKGKSKETDCRNYIRVLQVLDEEKLYVCGTHAFQPLCDYLSLQDFTLLNRAEDGRGKCSFDPAQSFTSVMVDGELYSGTAYNFLGSEPIISRSSASQGLLRTEYSTSWLNEPSFVFADVIREDQSSPEADDDKVYYFFTEVSVEYEFFGKLLIPRIARVCKGDLGGQRTLQKKWTSFLKAKLVCSMPELNFVFNVVHDVFILKAPHWRDNSFLCVFFRGNVGLSAVCAYNMSSVHEVFSRGKFMQKVTVEQSHTKWVRYDGVPPSPRPGACISSLNRQQNISSSLFLPDKTLQFVKDHPLLEDPLMPIGNGPRLMATNTNYTQITVHRIRALDHVHYHVLFTTTDKGFLHKSVILENEVHTVEEIQLFRKPEPIKTLLLSSGVPQFLYAGSDSGVVQVPSAFCQKYSCCMECVLARDPYCAWDTVSSTCINILQDQADSRKLKWMPMPHFQFEKAASLTQRLFHWLNPCRSLIQNLRGDAGKCPPVPPVPLEDYRLVVVQPGGSADLPCPVRSNRAQVFWKLNGELLSEASRFLLMGPGGLLIYSVMPQDAGHYECWTVEFAGGRNFTRLVSGFLLRLDLPETTPSVSTHDPTTTAQGNPINTPGLTSAQTDPPSALTTPPNTAVFKHKSFNPAPEVSNFPTLPEVLDAKYLQHDNSAALLALFLLFFLLFLAALAYNCYMQYLPAPCLRLRAALIGSEKKPPVEYAACEAGLMDAVQGKTDPANQSTAHPLRLLRDTGYETEPECGNGGVCSNSFDDTPSKDRPFDIDCVSQPIEFADADDAAAPPPFPPVDEASLSSASAAGASLLPPLLHHQSWSLHPHQSFLLLCLALGPVDLRVEWLKNGRSLKTPVSEHRQTISYDAVREGRRTISHDAMLVSSWLEGEALDEDVQYRCTAVSRAGNDTSERPALISGERRCLNTTRSCSSGGKHGTSVMDAEMIFELQHHHMISLYIERGLREGDEESLDYMDVFFLLFYFSVRHRQLQRILSLPHESHYLCFF
ncbi:hypothetical protein DNTS_004042 [Danionella cerebrum]|uniref:Semaphorin-3C n=1 Tax=Danionella cerebrum TaxID=2873325 RepID=A0A553RIF0_9TELE|nr:hypothetical protein DNTS_004042 [Danionella translucida]